MAATKDFSKRIDTLMQTKKISKQQYASAIDLPFASNMPLVGYFVEHESEVALLETMFEGVRAMRYPCIIFWSGKGKLPLFLYEEATVVTPNDAHFSDLWKACDVAFCFGEKSVKKAFDNGVVPLVLKGTRGSENYDPIRERGNAFIFEGMHPWMMFAALSRAAETFKFPFDWKGIVKNGKK